MSIEITSMPVKNDCQSEKYFKVFDEIVLNFVKMIELSKAPLTWNDNVANFGWKSIVRAHKNLCFHQSVIQSILGVSSCS